MIKVGQKGSLSALYCLKDKSQRLARLSLSPDPLTH